MTRPTWDEIFMEIADVVGKRGTCDRGKSGAVITRNNRLLTTGYVGSPPGFPHCDEVGHLIHTVTYPDGTVSDHCMRTLHAEENAILQAAIDGISLVGATLYCKMVPCSHRCAMKIIRIGITRVVAKHRYQRDEQTINNFKKAGIKLDIINDDYCYTPNIEIKVTSLLTDPIKIPTTGLLDATATLILKES